MKGECEWKRAGRKKFNATCGSASEYTRQKVFRKIILNTLTRTSRNSVEKFTLLSMIAFCFYLRYVTGFIPTIFHQIAVKIPLLSSLAPNEWPFLYYCTEGFRIYMRGNMSVKYKYTPCNFTHNNPTIYRIANKR